MLIDNPADQLVAVIDSNRTSHKSHALFDNAGHGCLALQYSKAYQGRDSKKPPDASFVDTFAPNCGVEAPTLAPITGRLSTYVSPEEAFDILIENARSLQILYDKNHTEVGATVSGTDGGAPYFWCALFSNGTTNSNFVLQGGVAKTVHPGCFSGNDDDCSGGSGFSSGLWAVAAGIWIAVADAFGFLELSGQDLIPCIRNTWQAPMQAILNTLCAINA
ncbi:Signal peptidase complex subunit, partial [Musa troglodytarum]